MGLFQKNKIEKWPGKKKKKQYRKFPTYSILSTSNISLLTIHTHN